MKKQKLLLLKIVVPILLTSAIISCKKTSLEQEAAHVPGKLKGNAASTVTGHPAGLQTNLRMFGYMSVYTNEYVKYMDSVNLAQLTDVAIAFINPDANGVFTISNDIAQAVVKVHNLNVRVHMSIGGGGGPAYWDNLIKPANRASVISNIRNVLTTYDFEGVDVDLEGARITSDYNGFMMQLSDTLRQYSKLLSAALARYQGNLLSADVYGRLDYLNAMVYDYTSSSPRSHSSLANFQYDFNFFKTKLPAAKLNMGVPAYAWEYNGNTPTTQISIKDILKQYPDACALNYKYPTPIKSWWYDGHPVLRQKVAYCLQQGVGGMMMWQIMHDPQDDASSLLKLMNFCAANPALAGFDTSLNYSFTASNSWQVMEVASASLNNFAGVQQNIWTNGDHQKWFLSVTNNEFKITNKNSGKVLDEVDETASGLGVQFVQNPWHGGGNQRYQFVPNELGYYKLVNVASTRLASVYQASTTPGTKIVQWTDGNGANQQWVITRR